VAFKNAISTNIITAQHILFCENVYPSVYSSVGDGAYIGTVNIISAVNSDKPSKLKY
jgi:hypothetical protein